MAGSIPSVLSRRFVFREDLGAGGMGCVVLVEDLHEGGRLRALKWVGSTDLQLPNVFRHRHEYQLLSTWRHPYVLPVYDFVRLPLRELQFFTMDYLRGPSLAELVRRGELEQGRRIVGQLLHALSFVHQQGWVHCDIKPQNVLLRDPLSDGPSECCLIDFGLAGEVGSAAGRRVLGTVHYMSPERFHGTRLDPRSDLYSVGVMMYQVMTGRLPLTGRRKVDLILRQLHSTPPLMASLVDFPVDPEFESLVGALLEKKPADRPRDAEEVLAELQRFWPEIDAVERPALLAAYASRRHYAGWEAPLQSVTGPLIRSMEGSLAADFDLPRFRDSDSSAVLPLRTSVCGSIRSRVCLVAGARADDRECFSRAIARRSEILGIPQVQIQKPELGLSRLISGLADVAPVGVLGDALGIRKVAYEFDQAVDRGEPTRDVDLGSVVEWMRRVADEAPVLVVLGRPDVVRRLTDLLDQVRAHDQVRPTALQWLMLGEPELVDELAGRWGDWVERVQIPSLDPESHMRWWSRRLGGWRPPKDLDVIFERECEGSPAFLERLFRALIDSGVVERVGGKWSVGPRTDLRFDPLDLPGGFGGEVLEAVAIAGAEATIETLSELTGRSISALRCALTVLESIWVVERQGVYEFTDLRDHFAVKDACRPDRWRTGKATIARRIESSLQGCGRAEQLAQAWLSAGEIEAGLRWTRAAAVESIKSEDLVATQRVLERASEATDQLPRALELHLVSLRRRFGPIEAARTDVLEGRGREDDAAAVLLYSGQFVTGLTRADKLREPSEELRMAAAEANLALGRDFGTGAPLIASELEGWRLDLEALRREEQSLEGARSWLASVLASAQDGTICASWSSYLLGRYHGLRGRHELAIPCFRVAAFGFSRRRLLRFQVRAMLQQGLSLALVGSSGEASFLASRSQELVNRVGGILERIWLDRLAQPLGIVSVT